MFEYKNDDPIQENLAHVFLNSVNGDPKYDDMATRIAVELLQDFYAADNPAFDTASLKPLSFRDTPMLNSILALEQPSSLNAEQQRQLTVLKEAVTLEKELLLAGDIVPVVPDINHWDFIRAAEPTSGYSFNGPGKRPLIAAWEELRYAGLLSNPTDPSLEEFEDTTRILNAQRMVAQAGVIAEKTGCNKERLLKTAFVNAGQVMGRRLAFGTPEGQLPPSFWVNLADVAKQALEIYQTTPTAISAPA